MDIATLLETAVQSADAVSNAAQHAADLLDSATSQAATSSDCCGSNNPTNPG